MAKKPIVKKPNRKWRLFDASRKQQFIKHLRQCGVVTRAARSVGVSKFCIYTHRKQDSNFAQQWDAALGRESEMAPRIINPGGHGARTVMAKQRHDAFSDAQKEAFLHKLAETCNITRSAEYAGTTRSTVLRHRNNDPAFQAAFRQVTDHAHEELAMELLARARFGTPKAQAKGSKDEGTVPAYNDGFALRVLERLDRRAENRAKRDSAVSGPHTMRAKIDKRLADMRARLRETRPELMQGADETDGDTAV